MNRTFSFLTSFNSLQLLMKNFLGYDLHRWFFPELNSLWGKSSHLAGIHRRPHFFFFLNRKQNIKTFQSFMHLITAADKSFNWNCTLQLESLVRFTCLLHLRGPPKQSLFQHQEQKHTFHITRSKGFKTGLPLSSWPFVKIATVDQWEFWQEKSPTGDWLFV